MRHALILLGAGLALVWVGACSDSDSPGRNLNASSSGATTGGDGGEGGAALPCVPDCVAPLECCNGICANLDNDIENCGVCFKSCPGPHGVCVAKECEQAPCTANPNPMCAVSEFCCGEACCTFTDLCCESGGTYTCTPPNENGSCPP